MLYSMCAEEEPRPTLYCDGCGSPLFYGDDYFEINDLIICEECVESRRKTIKHTAEEMDDAV